LPRLPPPAAAWPATHTREKPPGNVSFNIVFAFPVTHLPQVPDERPAGLRDLILYAEDDPNDAFFFELAAKRAGLSHPITIVEDGQAAVSWLKGEGPFADRNKHPLPTALVLDLKMPRMNGFEVLEWVRSEKHLKNLPVVILSSSGESRDLKRANELGATGFFVKTAACEDIVQYLSGIRT
jgi:CheY-like chemotaxis protein